MILINSLPHLEPGHHLLHLLNQAVDGDPPHLLHVLHQLEEFVGRSRSHLDPFVNRLELLIQASERKQKTLVLGNRRGKPFQIGLIYSFLIVLSKINCFKLSTWKTN